MTTELGSPVKTGFLFGLGLMLASALIKAATFAAEASLWYLFTE